MAGFVPESSMEGGKLSRWVVAKPNLYATSSSVTSSPPLALPSRSTRLAGLLLSRAGGARSMPPNPAQNVPPVTHKAPPGPHRRHVNSCPRERERGYRPIPSDFLGGLLQRLSSDAAGLRLTPSRCMCVCRVYILSYCIYPRNPALLS